MCLYCNSWQLTKNTASRRTLDMLSSTIFAEKEEVVTIIRKPHCSNAALRTYEQLLIFLVNVVTTTSSVFHEED